MFAARAALLSLLAACWSSSAPPPPLANRATEPAAAPRSIAGTYRVAHEIMMVCDTGTDGWCPEPGEDTLRVTERGDGSIEVAIELVRTNAHTCSFEGVLHVAPASAGRRWLHESGRRDDDGADDADEPYCKLELAHTPSKLTISAEGCREWCGVRASLDAEFPASPSDIVRPWSGRGSCRRSSGAGSRSSSSPRSSRSSTAAG